MAKMAAVCIAIMWQILSSTAIYFNNHGVWFDETASKEGEISVEHWVAKIFAKTAVGEDEPCYPPCDLSGGHAGLTINMCDAR